MQKFFLSLVVLLCLNTTAQIKLHISDSLVVYSPDYGYPENDSLVFIQQAGEVTFCDAYEVYFDKEYRQLAYKSFSKGDTCTVFHYWRNGKLKRKTLHVNIDGSLVWWYDEIYCSNGSLLFKGPSPNQPGSKLIVNYYCNGNKRNEFYHNGYGTEGKMTWWHENGQIQSENYFENNEPAGTWKYYDEKGKLEKTERYEKGVLLEIEIGEKK